MSTGQTLALGAVAGFTIFLGLPLGRVQSANARLRAGLSALACGVSERGSARPIDSRGNKLRLGPLVGCHRSNWRFGRRGFAS